MSVGGFSTHSRSVPAARHPDLTRLLARVALDARREFDDDDRTFAAQCLLDWSSVTLAALDEPLAATLEALFLTGTAAPSPSDAAVALGTLSHLLDFDDVHNELPGHTGATVVTATVVAAQLEVSTTYDDALCAITVGVEIAAMLGRLLGSRQHIAGWHPTATIGAVASAVAALLTLDPHAGAKRIADAIGLAACQAGGFLASFGTTAKAWQVGCSARNGLLAGMAAARDVTVSADLLGAAHGYVDVFGGGMDGSVRGLTNEHAIRRVVFKRYAACFATHAAIDAAQALMRDPEFDLGEIENTRVSIGPRFAGIVLNRSPRDGLQAKFSLATVVALALSGCDLARQATFSEFDVEREPYRRLEATLTTHVAQTIPAAGARVEIRMRDGAVLVAARPEPVATVPPADAWSGLTRKWVAAGGSASAIDALRLSKGAVPFLTVTSASLGALASWLPHAASASQDFDHDAARAHPPAHADTSVLLQRR